MSVPWRRLVDAVLGVFARDPTPREVQAALDQAAREPFDRAEYEREGSGTAPPDAPHIPDDGRI